MLKQLCLACLILIAMSFPCITNAQDSATVYDKVYSLPDKLFGLINKKSAKVQQGLTRSTLKYIQKLSKREARIKRQLARKDSAAAQEIFGSVDERYFNLSARLNHSTGELNPQTNDYVRGLDSMKTTLQFLDAQKMLREGSAKQMQLALSRYQDVQLKLNQTVEIQKILTERQRYLQERLVKYGLSKQLEKYKQQVYYYRAQVHQYKVILNDPHKLEAQVLLYVSKIPAFQKFFNQYSDLASLFHLPVEGEDLSSLQGLQTRLMLTEDLQQRFGTGTNMRQYIGSSMTDAQSGLNILKNRLNQSGGSGDDLDLPNFKPNEEKTKSFLKRLELGSNMQSTRSRIFFPMTTDVGVSLGYKFSQHSIAGIGGSYKMGWGRDIRHITISHQGLGLRSFIDIKLKKSFWFSGGYEMNYFSQFNSIAQLKDQNAWQQSGLVGLSKKISLKSKVLKNSRLQLLWDFLSYQQVPRTQPIIYRIGYTF